MDDPTTSAEVLRRAAGSRDAPPRLLRAADSVLEGKFTWEDVANGRMEHPHALALVTPKAQEKLWPLLRRIAAEIDAEEDTGDTEPREITEEDDYYEQFKVMRPAFDLYE